MAGEAKTAVLLATYNGARFLEQQLQSLAAQTVARIDIWASDDGSTDATTTMLRDWAGRWSKGAFHILDGPRQGFAENFRAMLVNPDIDADLFAFCDQDDVWAPEKLAAAADALRGAGERPALYSSPTRNVDAGGNPIGRSAMFLKPPSFANALVQSIGGANTIVLNRAARELVAVASRRTGFLSHDWWSYLLVTGAGGVVLYDQRLMVDYRQHGGNVVGENSSLRARLGRVWWLIGGGFRAWNDRNMKGLEACHDLLEPAALSRLDAFRRARSGPLGSRLGNLKRSGVYRQNLTGQVALWVACVLGRL